MKTFKHCSIAFTPTAVEGGFMLKSKESPRVLFVTEKGVFECARDGSDKPLELFDCGPLTHLKVRAHLGDTAARDVVAADEAARRVKLIEDAAKAAVEAAKKKIAEADAVAAKTEPKPAQLEDVK